MVAGNSTNPAKRARTVASPATYVSAVEGAGLAARVIPNYMPARDRIVGARK
jgi:hypothetical protein